MNNMTLEKKGGEKCPPPFDGGLRFDPVDHSYWLGDRRLIGVSEAIQAVGLKDYGMVSPEILEHARQRGIAVHAACEYLDQNDLAWGSVSPEIEPYVRAYESFLFEIKPKILAVEKQAFDEALGFAGTIDRVVEMGGQSGVLDLKTYSVKPGPVCGVQLAAYAHLAEPNCAMKRWTLWLRKDAQYRLTEWTDAKDEGVFLACLKIAKWKAKKK